MEAGLGAVGDIGIAVNRKLRPPSRLKDEVTHLAGTAKYICHLLDDKAL